MTTQTAPERTASRAYPDAYLVSIVESAPLCVRCGTGLSYHYRTFIPSLVSPELELRMVLICGRCIHEYQRAGASDGLSKEQLEEILIEKPVMRIPQKTSRWRSYQRRLKDFLRYCGFTEEERRRILQERREYRESLADKETRLKLSEWSAENTR